MKRAIDWAPDQSTWTRGRTRGPRRPLIRDANGADALGTFIFVVCPSMFNVASASYLIWRLLFAAPGYNAALAYSNVDHTTVGNGRVGAALIYTHHGRGTLVKVTNRGSSHQTTCAAFIGYRQWKVFELRASVTFWPDASATVLMVDEDSIKCDFYGAEDEKIDVHVFEPPN